MAKNKPRVFIGSSKESLEVVYALQELLSDAAEVVPWKHASFELSKTFVENIESELSRSDFGIFVFTGDDIMISNNETKRAVRDNVLFEFGLFSGSLGRNRVFIVAPDNLGANTKIPSDLFGLTLCMYSDNNAELKTRLGACATNIRKAINKERHRKDKSNDEHRVKRVLTRGDTGYITIMADAALYMGDHRHEYSKELRRRLKSREIVPMKYLYRTEQASNHWLNICKKESYRYYRNSLALLRGKVTEISQCIIEAIGNNELDLVSVGSGNGEKDSILLREFTKDLKENEYIYYYPVDISDTLMEEAVRNAAGKGIKKDHLKTKALLADFTKLSELQCIYEERPLNNVFSVLGNTIGNADEAELMSSLADAMLAGDIVIIEFNIGKPTEDDPLLRELDNLHHDFTPLSSIGVEFNEQFLEYKLEQKSSSIVNGASSMLATYKTAIIDGDQINSIKLSIVHHYDFKQLKAKIEESLNVKTIFECQKDDVGLLVAQRHK